MGRRQEGSRRSLRCMPVFIKKSYIGTAPESYVGLHVCAHVCDVRCVPPSPSRWYAWRLVTLRLTSPIRPYRPPTPAPPGDTAREARSPHGHRGPAVLGVGRLAYRGRAR